MKYIEKTHVRLTPWLYGCAMLIICSLFVGSDLQYAYNHSWYIYGIIVGAGSLFLFATVASEGTTWVERIPIKDTKND